MSRNTVRCFDALGNLGKSDYNAAVPLRLHLYDAYGHLCKGEPGYEILQAKQVKQVQLADLQGNC